MKTLHALLMTLIIASLTNFAQPAQAGTGHWSDVPLFTTGLPSVPIFATVLVSGALVGRKKMAVVDAEQDALAVLENAAPTDRFFEAQQVLEELHNIHFESLEAAAIAILEANQTLKSE